MENNKTEKPTEESNWIGPSGQRWLANFDHLEQMVRPIGQALIQRAALRPGENVIEIGCGAGEMTLEIAQIVAPSGRVTAIDISPPLVAQAQRRADALAQKLPVQFMLGDAAHISVPAAPADCLLSRFGTMFFSQPFEAFTHLHSFLRPAGRFAFACWACPKENLWMGEMRDVLSEHFDLPKPVPRMPGPFAFQEPDYIKELLASARFKDVQIEPWKARIPLGGTGSDPQTATESLLKAISLAKVLVDAPPALQELVRQKLRDRLSQWTTATGVQVPASVWLVTAVT